jgi:hypothetical protein
MFSISLSPAPVAPDLLSVSVDLPVLHFSHKWSHTTCGLCAWFSPSIRAVACVRTWFPSYNVHCMDGPHFVYTLVCWWALRLFPPFDTWKQCY